MVGGHVKDLLEEKGTDVLTVATGMTVYECISKMVDANVGSAVVLDRADVAGIFTERDYLRRIALEGRTSRETNVEEVMTEDVLTVGLDETVRGCLAIMTKAKCRHLPVVVDGKLSGIISIGDCVRHISKDALEEVDHLHGYIQRHIADRYPS